ncbi:MAG: thymidine kinase [Gammaproteobacteria bacterium]|nr:thymidine kinase [Gammaproteobacteria bacterium]
MAQLYFYYSTMNAGKSTSLLQSAYNYQERGMNALIFTAAIDNRMGVGKVSSRIGLNADAQLYTPTSNLFDTIIKQHNEQTIDCVLIDESQFLSKQQVHQLASIVDELKIPVLCYGIRTDFLGELFEGSKYLLAWADKLIELKTICCCGKKATMVVRYDSNKNVIKDGEQVEVGGNDKYMSYCRKHFHQVMTSGNLL